MPDDLPAGVELDLLVAEHVMGWTRWVNEERPQYGVFLLSEPPGASLGRYRAAPDEPLGPLAVRAMPDYSTSIATAWRVVEHLREQGWHMDLASSVRGAALWDCRLFGPQEQRAIAHAATAPHAICLAALKALENTDA